MTIKKQKGSVLAYSLVILSVMLLIAAGISSNSVVEKKSANTTEASTQAFQTADSGLNIVVKKLSNADSASMVKTISQFFSPATCSSAVIAGQTIPGITGATYDLSFFSKSDPGNALACTEPISKIYRAKAVGKFKGIERAVDAVIGQECGTADIPDRTVPSIIYKEILAEDGKCWLDRNLGATTRNNDITGYGWYFQWGRKADGHQIATSGTSSNRSSTTDVGDLLDTGGVSNDGKFIIVNNNPPYWLDPTNDNLWQVSFGNINNPCPEGFKVPSRDELNNLLLSANIIGNASAFTSALKLPTSGYRLAENGNLQSQGSFAYYWTSSVTTNNGFSVAWALLNGPTNPYFSMWGSDVGLSVRCIKE